MKYPPCTRPAAERRREWRRAIALTLLAAGSFHPFAGSLLAAEEAEAETEEEPVTYRNWVDFSIGGTIVDGNSSAMSARTGLRDGVYGGVSGMHYEVDLDDRTLMKIDGRGIFDNGDYSLLIDVNREDLGYIRGGLRQFRTYSNISGGYFPPDLWFGNQFNSVYVDNQDYWFEAGLRLPDWPEITLSYTHHEREGEKASTVWGDVDTVAGIRKISPAWLGLDEKRDTLGIDISKEIGLTSLQVGGRYDHQQIDNTRNLEFFPGAGPALERQATQRDSSDSDLWNAHGSTVTRFNERVWLSVGYAYTHLSSDGSGYRAYGNGYDPDLANRLPSANTFQDLASNGQMSQNVANINLFWEAASHIRIIPTLRIEQQSRDAGSFYGSPALPLSPLAYTASSDRGLLDVAGGLELRYDGITNLVLFARGDWLTGQGNLDETWDNVSTAANVVQRSTDDDRFWQKYTIGANWYPLRKFSLGGGYYYKQRQNNFDHPVDSTSNLPGSGDRYPAYIAAQQYSVNDGNVRATWRPLRNLTLVARYDIQLGELNNEHGTLGEVQSAQMTSQIFGGTISWIPFSRVYLQARGSVVEDQTKSDVSSLTAAIQNSRNDYWTATGTIGYAVSNDIDLQGSYTYYRAPDFEANYASGQPYGADLREQWANATLTWRMNPRIRWVASYSYGTSQDDLYGGYNDFDVHILNASMLYRF